VATPLVRRAFALQKRSVWSFSWPTTVVSTYEAKSGAAGFQPNTDYREVYVRAGQVLTLNTGGNYFIRRLTLDSGGKIKVANGQIVRLALSERPVLNGDVLAKDQTDTSPTKFLLAVLSSGAVAVNGAFQGLLVAPKGDIAITAYGNSSLPVPQRGAFWGSSVEIHQGAVLSQGVDPALFIDAGEGVVADVNTDPASKWVKFVGSVGYMDGTNCDHWPKDLQRSQVFDNVVDALPGQAKSDALVQLKTALQALNVGRLVSIGSSRSLTLASYAADVSADGEMLRHWVAVDETAGVACDLSHQHLCSEEDILSTAVDPNNLVCKRQTINLNFGSVMKQFQVLRRVPSRIRTRDDAVQNVVLVAPEVRVQAPPDGYPMNTVQLDVNLVVAAKKMVGVTTSSGSVGLDVKPYNNAIVANASDLANEVKAPSKRGLIAIFADSIESIGAITTHNGIRVAAYTPMDNLTNGQFRPMPVSPSYGAPASDVSLYPEYVFPKKWLLEYRCSAPNSTTTEQTLTAPPSYFCQQWQMTTVPASNTANLMCYYAKTPLTVASDRCGKLWCDGTLKNGGGYALSFIPKMTRQNISCDATAHVGLLDRRRTADAGGWAILAAGAGADNVELRAPQGEATKFDSSLIQLYASQSNPVLNSDVLRALTVANAFSSPSATTPFWDSSTPGFNPTVPRCSFKGTSMPGNGSVAMTCAVVNTPFSLTMWSTPSFDAYTGQSDYVRTSKFQTAVPDTGRNAAAVSINYATTTYLLGTLDYNQQAGNNYQQQTFRSASAIDANTGAQVASGGDYFKVLDSWATNATMATAVPGAEFEALRPILGSLAALTVATLPTDNLQLGAVELTTAEQQRILGFADAYTAQLTLSGDHAQPWLTDMTGTPYGKVLTG